MNPEILKYSLIAISLATITVVLLQPKSEGLSGSAFGGMSGGEFYKSRRGIEKVLHYATIVLIALLCINALLLAKFS